MSYIELKFKKDRLFTRSVIVGNEPNSLEKAWSGLKIMLMDRVASMVVLSSILVWVLVHDQKQVREERVYLACSGTQGRNLEAEIKVEAMAECCLWAYSSCFSQFTFV